MHKPKRRVVTVLDRVALTAMTFFRIETQPHFPWTEVLRLSAGFVNLEVVEVLNDKIFLLINRIFTDHSTQETNDSLRLHDP